MHGLIEKLLQTIGVFLEDVPGCIAALERMLEMSGQRLFVMSHPGPNVPAKPGYWSCG